MGRDLLRIETLRPPDASRDKLLRLEVEEPEPVALARGQQTEDGTASALLAARSALRRTSAYELSSSTTLMPKW